MDGVVGLARRHWLLVGTLAVMLAVLVLFPSVWRIQVEGHSRSGRAWHISMAARGLWIAGAGLLGYVLAGVTSWHLGGRGVASSTEEELTVARWLLRAAGLGAMWLAIYATIP